MGEVYRADDMKLARTAALNLLRREMSADPVWRTRFFASGDCQAALPPKMCRVYDVADIDAKSMTVRR